MKLLVGYDETALSRKALRLAGKRASTYGGTIEVVTVIEESPEHHCPDIAGIQDRISREVTELLSEDQPQHRTHVVTTDLHPADTLIQFAEHNGIDELVIGVGSGNANKPLHVGHNAQYLLMNARFPILTVN